MDNGKLAQLEPEHRELFDSIAPRIMDVARDLTNIGQTDRIEIDEKPNAPNVNMELFGEIFTEMLQKRGIVVMYGYFSNHAVVPAKRVHKFTLTCIAQPWFFAKIISTYEKVDPSSSLTVSQHGKVVWVCWECTEPTEASSADTKAILEALRVGQPPSDTQCIFCSRKP